MFATNRNLLGELDSKETNEAEGSPEDAGLPVPTSVPT